jgi:hypothetical protein
MITPSIVVNIAEVMVDITAECSRNLYRNTSRRYIRQNTIRLKAIGIFY